jgi:hypothetical protein
VNKSLEYIQISISIIASVDRKIEVGRGKYYIKSSLISQNFILIDSYYSLIVKQFMLIFPD